MNGWEVVKLGKRNLRPGDYRAEIVLVLRSDCAGGVLEVGDQLRAVPKATPSDCPLTKIQLEVLERLGAGLTYKEIAAERGVAVPTIRTHLHKIYKRLGVVDRAQAVLKAAAEGWL